MAALTSGRKSTRLGILGILLALIFFLALQVLADGLLRDLRLDLTADERFTLSEGTERVLTGLDEPIVLRFYLSPALVEASPLYASHAKRVRELLERYASLAEGKLVVQYYEPEPFSPEEDQAQGEGLEPIELGGGEQALFGLAGFNSTDDREAIALFAPERDNFLEYDLTRLIMALSNPDKPVVGIIGALPLSGGPASNFQPWLMMQVMRQFFDLRTLGGDVATIDPEIDVLMLAQPGELSDVTRYAIDQYVLAGRPLLALVDPHSEALVREDRQGGMNPMAATRAGLAPRSMAPLLAAWGVELPPDRVVGDLRAAQRVQFNAGGRTAVTDYVVWLALGPEAFDREDVVTAELQELRMNSVGALSPAEGATTVFDPLIRSSADSMLIPSAELHALVDPARLLAEFEPEGERHVLAARIAGAAASAFPDGTPEAAEGQGVEAAAHRAEAEPGINVIVIADSDFLHHSVWTAGGGLATVPIADNADLLIGALDHLAGGQELLDLPTGGRLSRPLTLIEDIRREAEQRYRAREQALRERIQEAEARLGELLAGGGDQAALSQAGTEAIRQLRSDLIEARQELRAVRRAMREDIEEVETLVKLVNIWAVPLLIGLLAVVLGLWRRARAARRAGAGRERPA